VGAESTAIRRILRELRSDKSVSGTAIGAAAFGLFAFRIGHGRKGLVVAAVDSDAPVLEVKGSE